MNDRVTGFLDALSRRERILLLLLVGVGLPLLLWGGAAQPLLESRASALREVTVAREERDWVAERQAEWLASGASSGASAPASPIGLAGLEAELSAAGLRALTRVIEDAGEGHVRMNFEAAPFERLGRFLDRAETGLGYRLAGMRITAGSAPGLVDARVELAPR